MIAYNISHSRGTVGFQGQSPSEAENKFLLTIFGESTILWMRKEEKFYEQSIKNEQDFLNFVNGYLCKNAKVEFAECQSGGGDNGEILKEYLKTIFSPDVILVLYNTNIKWSYSGVIEVPEKM